MESPYQEDPIARTTKPFIAPVKPGASDKPVRPLGIALLAILLVLLTLGEIFKIWSTIHDFPDGDQAWVIFELTLRLGLSILYIVTAWGLWIVEPRAIRIARAIFGIFVVILILSFIYGLFSGAENVRDLQVTVIALILYVGILFYLSRDRIKELL